MKAYFENENAVATLPNGVEYNEITGEGSKKSTSEVNDISNITKEAMSMVAQGFPDATSTAYRVILQMWTNLLMNCLQFVLTAIVDLIETEINRKRYGKAAYLSGSYLKVDTTCIKHIDIFSVAVQADKLISDGLYSVDELRLKLGDLPLNTWWSQKHWMTKNYSEIAVTELQTNSNSKGDETDETG
jgi:hypothetical protein